jgi:hypothetical protein
MSRIWKERFDVAKHRDFMTGYQDAGGLLIDSIRDNLLTKWVYFVRVASFTFQFHTIAQIAEAHAYFSKTVHPARRESGHELEHYWQRWFERLPPGLNGGTKRVTILKALEAALDRFTVPNQTVQRTGASRSARTRKRPSSAAGSRR